MRSFLHEPDARFAIFDAVAFGLTYFLLNDSETPADQRPIEHDSEETVDFSARKSSVTKRHRAGISDVTAVS